MIVLSVAMATPPGRSLPSSRDERLPSNSGGVVGATPLTSLPVARRAFLLEERDLLAGHDPLVVDGLKRPIRLDCFDRLVDAWRQRTVLLEHRADLIGLELRAELTDDRALRLRRVEILELSVAHV